MQKIRSFGRILNRPHKFEEMLWPVVKWGASFRFHSTLMDFKDSPDLSRFILEINVGKRRIRHRTTPKLNDEFLDRLNIDWRWRYSNSESFYVGSDSFRRWFKNKMAFVWTTLNFRFLTSDCDVFNFWFPKNKVSSESVYGSRLNHFHKRLLKPSFSSLSVALVSFSH